MPRARTFRRADNVWDARPRSLSDLFDVVKNGHMNRHGPESEVVWATVVGLEIGNRQRKPNIKGKSIFEIEEGGWSSLKILVDHVVFNAREFYFSEAQKKRLVAFAEKWKDNGAAQLAAPPKKTKVVKKRTGIVALTRALRRNAS